MTELINPITGPLELEAQGSPESSPWGADACAGPYALVDTSVTEGGSGYQLCGRLNYSPDTAHTYSFGLLYQKEGHEGGDLQRDQNHRLGLLLLGRSRRSVLARGDDGTEALTGSSERNFSLGVSESEGVKSVEFGSDIAAYSLAWRTSGRVGLKLRPYLFTASALPVGDSEGAETVATAKLQVGVDFQLSLLDTATKPPSSRLHDLGATIGVASHIHRIGKTHATAQTLSGASAVVSDSELGEAYGFGQGGSPSARLEDVSAIVVLNGVGTAGDENLDLELQLAGSEGQQNTLLGSKAAMTAILFALSTQDESDTALTQGTASTLGVAAGLMAGGMELDRSGRHSKTDEENRSSAANFLLFRSILNTIGFAIGWAVQKEEAGPALLQGSHQASLAAMSVPDPAGTGMTDARVSHHFVYEAVKERGRYMGYQRTAYLPSRHLYTRMKILGQTVPGVPAEAADDLTGRDPLAEGAQSKSIVSLGGHWEAGPLSLGIGARTLMAYGEGTQPVPGVGAEQQLLLSLGDRFRVEIGGAASQDYVDGNLELGVSAVAGARFAF